MPYSDLPHVAVSEIDKSQTPDTAVSDFIAAAVIGGKWGSPELTLFEKPADLVREFTWNGTPDIGDTGFFCAWYMLNHGVPLYLKREETTSKCSNVIVMGTSTGTGAAAGTGIVWASATAFSFGTSQVMAIVFYPGEYGDNFGIKIGNADDAAGTFELTVLKTTDGGSTWAEMEVIEMSRKHITDNFGNQLYCEDRIAQYNLPCIIVDNTGITEDEMVNDESIEVQADGGTDGTAPTATNIVSGWTEIQASEKDYRLLCSFGYEDSLGTIGTKFASVCNLRDYNVGLIDGPDVNASSLSTYRGNFSTSDNDLLLVCERFKYLDEFNNTWLWLPGSPVVGSLISEVRENNEAFKAFSGLRRGRFSCLGLKWNFTKTEMDALLGEQMNPLTRFGGSYLLMDNRTAQTTKSALSDMQVRFLFDYIAEVATEYLLSFIQEFNNADTRAQVQGGIQAVLDLLIGQGNLKDGSYCQCDGSNNTAIDIDNNKLIVDVYLKPYRTAKFIQVNIVALPTGVDITENI